MAQCMDLSRDYISQNPVLISLLEVRAAAVARGDTKAAGIHIGITDDAGSLVGSLIMRHRVQSALGIGFSNGFSSVRP